MSPASRTRVRPRGKLGHACHSCRLLKTRCFNDGTMDKPCERCTQQGLSCDYSRRKRGRKSKAELEQRQGDGGGSAQASSPSSAGELDVLATAVTDDPAWLPEANTDDPLMADDGDFLPIPSYSLSSQVEDPQFTPSSSVRSPAQHMRPPVDPVDAGGRPATSSSVDVSDRLNPPDFPRSHLHRREPPPERLVGSGQAAVSQDHDAGGGTLRRPFEDPITLGMLSEAQAVQMLDIFYEQLNPQIAVLDRGYHTFDHIKRASPILLSSVLAAVAKLFAFDLYQRMLNHAQTLINHKGMSGDGMYDIYDVQAILIQVYYKHPSDRTVWIRLGMALRIAQQLRLNESYHRPLPDAPVEKRRQLNRERTWMLLICFDRTYSYHFDLPLTVRPHEIFDAEEWARDHADLGIGTDWHLACSHDHGSYDDMLAMYRKSSGMTEAWSRQMLAQISNGYRKHLWRWFDSPDFLASVLSPREQRILRVDPLNQLLLVKEAELDLTSWESQTDLAEWMSLADQLVQQLELTTEDRGFLYLQDTSSLGMSSLALNLYKVFERQPSSAFVVTVQSLLRRLHNICVILSHGHLEEAPSYVGRFVQRLLRAMTAASRPTSRLPSPQANEDRVPELPDFDLTEFLGGASALIPENLEIENEYWSTMFSTTSEYPQIMAQLQPLATLPG